MSVNAAAARAARLSASERISLRGAVRPLCVLSGQKTLPSMGNNGSSFEKYQELKQKEIDAYEAYVTALDEEEFGERQARLNNPDLDRRVNMPADLLSLAMRSEMKRVEYEEANAAVWAYINEMGVWDTICCEAKEAAMGVHSYFTRQSRRV